MSHRHTKMNPDIQPDTIIQRIINDHALVSERLRISSFDEDLPDLKCNNTKEKNDMFFSGPRKHRKDSGRSAKQQCITVNTSLSQYPVISKATKNVGWKMSFEDSRAENWDVCWIDSGIGIDRFVRLAKSFQRINHFPGMIHIYRKNNLARAMSRMERINSIEYDFVPKTWFLPEDRQEIYKYLLTRRDNCVIMKPIAGAQGRGITLATESTFIEPQEPCVVQQYINRPLLINGYKFDLRIYVLVTCVDPLRVLIYKEGLCRLCTTLYQMPNNSNINNAYMHLTNYSINKYNSNYSTSASNNISPLTVNDDNSTDTTEDHASKRTITWLWESLAGQGHDVGAIWSTICDIVTKTVISIQAQLAHDYANCKLDGQNRNPFTCFELLGFDIMLTSTLEPVLIEVNHMPSLRTDSHIDMRVKLPLIENTLQLLNITVEERQRYIIQKQKESQMRLYGHLYDEHNRHNCSSNSNGGGRSSTRYNTNTTAENMHNCSGSKIKTSKHDTTEGYWKRYILNERRTIGDYQLVYPTDCYAYQPTRGRQGVYDLLLQQSQTLFDSALQRALSGDRDSPIPYSPRSNNNNRSDVSGLSHPYHHHQQQYPQHSVYDSDGDSCISSASGKHRNTAGKRHSKSKSSRKTVKTNSKSSSHIANPPYHTTHSGNYSESTYMYHGGIASIERDNEHCNFNTNDTGTGEYKSEYIKQVIERSNRLLASIQRTIPDAIDYGDGNDADWRAGSTGNNLSPLDFPNSTHHQSVFGPSPVATIATGTTAADLTGNRSYNDDFVNKTMTNSEIMSSSHFLPISLIDTSAGAHIDSNKNTESTTSSESPPNSVEGLRRELDGIVEANRVMVQRIDVEGGGTSDDNLSPTPLIQQKLFQQLQQLQPQQQQQQQQQQQVEQQQHVVQLSPTRPSAPNENSPSRVRLSPQRQLHLSPLPQSCDDGGITHHSNLTANSNKADGDGTHLSGYDNYHINCHGIVSDYTDDSRNINGAVQISYYNDDLLAQYRAYRSQYLNNYYNQNNVPG